jgi:hypothetical protein
MLDVVSCTFLALFRKRAILKHKTPAEMYAGNFSLVFTWATYKNTRFNV